MTAAVLVAAATLAGAPAPEAYFAQRSYAPGETARLVVVTGTARPAAVYRVGPEPTNALPATRLTGVRIDARVVAAARGLRVTVGDWPSGVYFARLGSGRSAAYAPFIVRPRRLGRSGIAVVLPTNTWQAYNDRDADGDGVGDTWYASAKIASVQLDRPFANHGVPPHFAQYDLAFLRWLARTRKDVDVLSDDDVEAIPSGDRLARLYRLVVFPGHEEYVTPHVYDIVERYRDLGGNLMFLSANNFFYRVDRRGDRLYRTGRWRDLGRPEARLVGIQYLDWNQRRYGNAPYVVRATGRAPWLFAGTRLHAGSRFGRYGIEIDAPTAASPHGLRVLATVPNVFGRGRSATMTYYTTRRGAKVFAAGTINFGGTALWPPVPTLLENLWRQLARP